ncbi:endonuclease [Streptomyces griseoflavus]|uniref:HNH endonuclease signature motif containing protein n=1 Tax=Streptomyces rimosus TaxID=1927 RepID=UPI0004C73A14|nr:HNH endonuclease signature motif containing protein [Streptomyces rimosus]KOG59215.1 endonuclease [Streptomyces griseoflavus]
MSSGVRYTRELLDEAARHCKNIDEVIAFIGVRPYHQLRRHIFQRFTHFGIDVAHFEPADRRTAYPRPTKAALQQAVASSCSVAAALRHLSWTSNHRTRTLFRRWTDEYGIDTSHFLGQAHQRGKKTHNRRAAPDILRKQDTGRRTGASLLRRALLESGVTDRCAECGTGPVWHGRPMTLEVDHINGDWTDNRQHNLRFLCPNCHAATSTWCRGGRSRD